METSRPFPGTVIGSAGPYSAAQWWDCWLAQSRSGGRLSRVADYDIGVFYAIANALEPASNVTEITVDTGASLIDGLYHENDASVAVPIPASGALTSRIDVIVVRKNYQQAVTYTPTGGAPTVPPREAHITVIRGVEAAGPSAPSLEQDVTRTTYWDIPIAQVQVSDAGALSNFTDLREFVDAEIKRAWIPAVMGYNVTLASDISLTYDSYPRILFPNGNNSIANGTIAIPNDFIGDATATFVCHTEVGATGTASFEIIVRYGTCGQVYSTHTDSYSDKPTINGNQTSCPISVDLTVPALGDFLFVSTIYKDQTDAGTYDDTLNAIGWYLEYLGWKK